MNLAQLIPAVALLAALPPLALAGPSSAAKRPVCDGKRATVVGTAGGDSFIPKNFDPGDVVALLGGSDYAQVGAHVDDVTICGGKGEDEIVGDAGAGTGLKFFGDGGADELGSLFEQGKRVAPHGFRLYGDRGHDIVVGSKGHDRIEGGSGPDWVLGSRGGDVVHGDSGDDDLSGGKGRDELFGDHDDDRLYGFYFQRKTPRRERVDSAFGGPGHDKCVARHRHSCKRVRR